VTPAVVALPIALWVPVTLVAAAAQTARNATQSGLTQTLGTLGATQVRFIYGFPFALIFLAIVVAITGTSVPRATYAFLAFACVGAVAQILGTAALLAAMRVRAFSVATAFTKTEALQVAVFGLIVLGEPVTWLRLLAIAVASAGVFLVARKPGEGWSAQSVRPAILGVASGALFAVAAIGFRGAILALPDAAFFVRATTTLAWSLGIQSLLLGIWMALFDRTALARTLGVWRQSLTAGFMGAFASQFWFLGFSLTAAANVRTLALVEVLFAQAVSRRLFAQRLSAREAIGMALVVAGVALLITAV
jgi:drug/metabolite transporter (DMT)-like permease